MRKAVKHSVKAFLGESWSQVLFLVVLTCGWACGRAAELDLLSDLRMDFIFQAISQRMISLAFRSQSIRSSGFPFAAVGKAHSLFLLRGVSAWACEYKISPFGQRDKLQPSSSLMQSTRNPDRSFFGTALLKPVPNKIIHRPSIASHQGRQVDIDRWLLGEKASWLGGRKGKGNGGKGREYCNR